MSENNNILKGFISREVKLVWPYRYKIFLFSLVGSTLAYILTLPIIWPPKYQSVVGLVPPSFNLTKSVNFHKTSYGGFGAAEPEDLERLVAALKSDSIRKAITKQFDLVKRWGFEDINDPPQAKKFNQQYNNFISIKITNLSTVSIEVVDEDPYFASAVARAFIEQADFIVEGIAKRKAGLLEAQRSLELLKAASKSAQDSLAQLRIKYKVYHLENLSEVISTYLLKSAFVQNDFHQKYDAMLSLEARIRYLEDKIADLTEEIIFRQENLRVYPSLVNVVNHGLPSLDKVSPNRPLIVILTGFLGLIFALIYFLSKSRTKC